MGVFANGSRMKVTFFGTGQTGIVDKAKWVSYSMQVENRIKTAALMKNPAFKFGLSQMKELINKIGLLLCHSHIEMRLWLRLS